MSTLCFIFVSGAPAQVLLESILDYYFHIADEHRDEVETKKESFYTSI